MQERVKVKHTWWIKEAIMVVVNVVVYSWTGMSTMNLKHSWIGMNLKLMSTKNLKLKMMNRHEVTMNREGFYDLRNPWCNCTDLRSNWLIRWQYHQKWWTKLPRVEKTTKLILVWKETKLVLVRKLDVTRKTSRLSDVTQKTVALI